MKHYFFAVLLALCATITNAQQEIWGTVANGGQYGYGYIFRSDAQGDNFTIMHHFNGLDGYSPGALLPLSNNKLYGVTTSGGDIGTSVDYIHSSGVMYEYDMTTNTFTILKQFTGANTDLPGAMPMGDGRRGLTEVSPGIIYSNIRMANSDRIFSYNTQTNTFLSVGVLPEFIGGSGSTTWGMRLTGALYKAEDGFLYGTTHERSQCPVAVPLTGSIVKVNPANGAITLPYIAPCGSLEQGDRYNSDFVAHNNELYSTTRRGGTSNNGTIYSYNPATTAYTKRHDFAGGLMGKQSAFLIKAGNGKFYGIADGGLPQNNLSGGGGLLYEFDPSSNTFTKKYDFLIESGWFMEVGIYPSSLIMGSNGKLYGTTQNGIFEYDTETNIIFPKGRFSIEFGAAHSYPSLTSVCRKPSYISTPLPAVPMCAGASFSHDLQSENTQSVIWYHNDAVDASHTATTLIFESLSESDAGTWRAELTNECGITQTQSITIVIASVPTILMNEETLETTATAESYQWINCGTNETIPGATAAVFEPGASGDFAVITTTGDCEMTSECFTFTTMGNETLLFPDSIIIFPNPVQDELWTKADELLSGEIYTMLGQRVKSFTSGKTNVSGLPAGAYFVSATTSKGILRGKFIKQ